MCVRVPVHTFVFLTLCVLACSPVFPLAFMHILNHKTYCFMLKIPFEWSNLRNDDIYFYIGKETGVFS